MAFDIPKEKASLKDILAASLGAFGAAREGRGAEFLAQMDANNQRLSDERLRLAAEDLRRTKALVDAGQLGQAQNLLRDRALAIQQVGGDNSDTVNQLNMVSTALTGDSNALNALNTELNTELQIAADRGFISLPAAQGPLSPEGKLQSDISRGFLTEDQAADPEEAIKDEERQFNRLDKLVTSAKKDKRIDNFIQVQSSLDRVLSADPTAAGDLSLVFSFMKMLDPGSVVREGEQALARNAAGVPARVRTTYNNLLAGQTLSPEQREDFKKQADNVFTSAKKTADKALRPFEGRAERFGLRKETLRESVFGVPSNALEGLPQGTVDNGDGTFTLPTGERVERE